jgi:hypothetical protein
LFGCMDKYCRSVLRPSPTWIGRCVETPKHIQEILIRHLCGIKSDTNTFCVIFDVTVRWIRVFGWIGRTAVPNNGIDNARSSIKIFLRAPKSSHGRLERRRRIFGRG